MQAIRRRPATTDKFWNRENEQNYVNAKRRKTEKAKKAVT
jgi:hypothetical protein